MSNFSNRDKGSSAPPSPVTQQAPFTEKANDPSFRDDSPPRGEYRPSNVRDSSQRRGDAGNRNSSRPMSMVQTYQPPLMDVNSDTPPELLPIFTYLNSHGNKLYQEGYFLKLDDQNSRKFCFEVVLHLHL
jgi:CCR4-NOT transcriptional complex subunit CAF120